MKSGYRQSGFRKYASGTSLFVLLSTTAMLSVGMGPTSAFAQASTTSFNIPAGPLGNALALFGRQANAQISYEASLVAGKTSTGIRGNTTSQSALSQILQNSGLAYRFTDFRNVLITSATSSDVSSQDGSTTLAPIVVRSANGRSDAIYMSPGSSDYISSTDMARIPPSSTGDLFKTTSGVISSGNRNGDTVDVNIRGMQGYNRVNMLIDGASSSSSDYRGYSGSRSRMSVDPSMLGGISVEKGPDSGPLGAGYNAGMVNAKTLEPGDILMDGRKVGVRMQSVLGGNTLSPPPALTGANAYSYGLTPDKWHETYPGTTDRPGLLGGDNFRGNVAAAMTTDNVDLLAAYSRVVEGNYFSGRRGGEYGRIETNDYNGQQYYRDASYAPGYEVYNTSKISKSGLLKGEFRFAEDQSLKLSYMFYDSVFGEHDNETVMQNASPNYPVIPTQMPPMTIRTNNYVANYKYTPDNDLIDLAANLWYVDKSESFWNSEKPGAKSDDVRQQYFYQTNLGGEIYNTSKFAGDWGNLTSRYGVSLSVERSRNNPEQCDSSRWNETPSDPFCFPRTDFYNPQGQREIGSVFVQNTYKPFEWLTLNGDLRYDAYKIDAVNASNDASGQRFNPKAAVTVEPIDGVQFYAQQAMGWRPPSLREMTMNFNVVPNPDLKPELSNNTEIGMNILRDGLFSDEDSLRLKVGYFINRTENYVARTRLPDYTSTWMNIDEARQQGWEANLKYDTGVLFGELNVTRYNSIKYCFPETGCVADVNRTPGGIPTDYQANYVPPKYNGSLTVGARLLEDRNLTIGARADFNGEIALQIGENGARQTEKQVIFNAFANYQYNERISANLSVENIRDDYYYDPMVVGRIPSPGRTFRATLTAKF